MLLSEASAWIRQAAELGRSRDLRELLCLWSGREGEAGEPVIDESDEMGKTALMEAAEKGHLACVQLLVQFGATLDLLSKFHYTALMFASASGHADIVQFLAEKGASLNIREKAGGMTACMKAVCCGHKSCIHVLVSFGADLTATDFRGRSVMDWAQVELDSASLLSTPEALQTAESILDLLLCAGCPLSSSPLSSSANQKQRSPKQQSSESPLVRRTSRRVISRDHQPSRFPPPPPRLSASPIRKICRQATVVTKREQLVFPPEEKQPQSPVRVKSFKLPINVEKIPPPPLREEVTAEKESSATLEQKERPLEQANEQSSLSESQQRIEKLMLEEERLSALLSSCETTSQEPLEAVDISSFELEEVWETKVKDKQRNSIIDDTQLTSSDVELPSPTITQENSPDTTTSPHYEAPRNVAFNDAVFDYNESEDEDGDEDSCSEDLQASMTAAHRSTEEENAGSGGGKESVHLTWQGSVHCKIRSECKRVEGFTMHDEASSLSSSASPAPLNEHNPPASDKPPTGRNVSVTSGEVVLEASRHDITSVETESIVKKQQLSSGESFHSQSTHAALSPPEGVRSHSTHVPNISNDESDVLWGGRLSGVLMKDKDQHDRDLPAGNGGFEGQVGSTGITVQDEDRSGLSCQAISGVRNSRRGESETLISNTRYKFRSDGFTTEDEALSFSSNASPAQGVVLARARDTAPSNEHNPPASEKPPTGRNVSVTSGEVVSGASRHDNTSVETESIVKKQQLSSGESFHSQSTHAALSPPEGVRSHSTHVPNISNDESDVLWGGRLSGVLMKDKDQHDRDLPAGNGGFEGQVGSTGITVQDEDRSGLSCQAISGVRNSRRGESESVPVKGLRGCASLVTGSEDYNCHQLPNSNSPTNHCIHAVESSDASACGSSSKPEVRESKESDGVDDTNPKSNEVGTHSEVVPMIKSDATAEREVSSGDRKTLRGDQIVTERLSSTETDLRRRLDVANDTDKGFIDQHPHQDRKSVSVSTSADPRDDCSARDKQQVEEATSGVSSQGSSAPQASDTISGSVLMSGSDDSDRISPSRSHPNQVGEDSDEEPLQEMSSTKKRVQFSVHSSEESAALHDSVLELTSDEVCTDEEISNEEESTPAESPLVVFSADPQQPRYRRKTTFNSRYIYYPYEELRRTYPEDIDITKKELYLTDEEFLNIFGLSKTEYKSLPKWKADRKKKELGLF